MANQQQQQRSWLKDGRMLTVQDAHECVQTYHVTYSRQRFAWLMKQAAGHGHKEEIAKVFRDAIPME